MFSKNMKKTRKAVQKLTKDGTTGLKQTIQKSIKKVKDSRASKVEMEEFEVEIGEI